MIRWNSETITSIDFYRLLFADSPLPMWILTPEGEVCLVANPAACRVQGYSLDELSGTNPCESRWDGEAALGDAPTLPIPSQTRFFRTKDGRGLSLAVTIHALNLAGDRLWVMTAVGFPSAPRPTDVSQPRNALIAETTGEGILQTDRRWRIVYANKSMGEMLGADSSQLLGRPITECFDGKVPISFRRHMRRQESRKRETYEIQWPAPHGPRVWMLVHAAPLLDAAGQFQGSLAMITDITKSRRVPQTLLESENRFRALAGSSHEGMSIEDNGIIIDATPRLAEILGLKVEHLLGRPVLDFVAPVHRELVRQKVAAREEGPYEHSLQRADGSLVSAEARARYIEYGGRPVRVTSILDISERKKYEELLRATITLLTLGNQALNPQSYADQLVELLRSWVRCPSVGIRLLGEDGRVNCQSGKGFDATFWHNSESLLDQKQCICARLAQAKPKPCEQLALTPRGSFYASHLSKFLRQMTEADRSACGGSLFQGQHESLAIVPIRAEKHTWGLIYLAAPDTEGLDEQQIQFVEMLAPQIGASLVRRELAENLRESEANLRQAESLACLGYWKSDLLTGQVKWSEETWRILGYDPQNHTASLALMLARVHPEDRPRVERAMAESREKVRTYFCDFRIVLPSGEIRHVCEHGELSVASGEATTKAFGVILDITEQKRAEEELRRYENIISNTPDGVAFLDVEYRYRIINPVYEKYSGLPREQLLGRSVAEYLGETIFQQQVRPKFDRCLRGETVTFQDWFTYPVVGRRFLTITYFPYRDARGQIAGVVASSRDITALKRVEDEYRRLAAIVEHTDDAVIVKNLEGIITNWNVGASRMYGYLESEVVGQPFAKLAPPGFQGDAVYILGKIKAGEHVRNFETTRQKKDGALIQVSLTISPLMDADGAIIGASVIGRDITQRQQVEAALQAAQALTQRHLKFSETLLAAMPIPVFYKDAAGRYMGCNPAFTEITGLSQDMIKGKRVDELWDCKMSRFYAHKDQELTQNPQDTQNYEGTVRDTRGERRFVLFAKRAFYDEANQLTGLVGAFLDITDRKTAERNLRLRERAIDASNEGICLIGSVFKDSPLLYVNQGFEQLTGYSRQEVLGKNMRFLQGQDTDPHAVAQLRAAALSGHPISLEILNYRKDGACFWNRISLTPSWDAEESHLLFVAVLTDVSRQRKTECALRRRETELATIQDHAPFLLCLLDKDHQLLQCNKRFVEFARQPENLLTGKRICAAIGCVCDLTRGEDRRSACANCALLAAINTTLATGQSQAMVEQCLTLNLGGQTQTYTLLVSAAHLKVVDCPRVLLCLEDITARKQAEVQLYQSRQMLQALSRRLVEAEESARRGVARDLHDRVGQNLTLLNINLGIIRNEILRTPGRNALNRLDDSMGLVNETMDHLRNVIADLRPAVLDDYGLAAALRWSGAQFEARTGLRIEVESVPDFPRLDATIETAVFRIVQEALTNVARHAQAQHVYIQLRTTASGLNVSIRDDGIGFTPSKFNPAEPPTSWGLATMRERAEGIGAKWHLHSTPGQGTEIVVDFSSLDSP
jgi:PAS domain S-box-containing protein